MEIPLAQLDSICVHGVGPICSTKYCTTIKLNVAVGAQEPRETRCLRKICCVGGFVSFRSSMPYTQKQQLHIPSLNNQTGTEQSAGQRSSAFLGMGINGRAGMPSDLDLSALLIAAYLQWEGGSGSTPCIPKITRKRSQDDKNTYHRQGVFQV
jgi:hypothetical protein